ncbi:MAG: hypothetical protein ABIJ08_00815 [Nanoarchaeota archaeon]
MTKMEKNFLLRLAIIFIVIWIIISMIISFSQINIMDYQYSGFPLKYSEGGGMCPEGQCGTDFYILNLIIDIMIWLAVAVCIALLSYKIRR